MTSGRAYRRGHRMNVATALRELQKHSGTQFDPAMVAEFVSLVDDGTIQIPSLSELDLITPATAHATI
jgi:response regulator RpfG family c-di-GMP phosphodiesterase